MEIVRINFLSLAGMVCLFFWTPRGEGEGGKGGGGSTVNRIPGAQHDIIRFDCWVTEPAPQQQ